MSDNYAVFSNGNVKVSGQALNAFYPKLALHKNTESLNSPLLAADNLSAYANNPDYFIVEPLADGWGVTYQTVYASGLGQSVVCHFILSSVTYGVWRTFNGSVDTLEQSFVSPVDYPLSIAEFSTAASHRYSGKFVQNSSGNIITIAST
jgi:hypothetical protein